MPNVSPVLLIILPEGRGEIAFSTTKEVEAWVKYQAEFYTWVFSVASNSPSFAQLRSEWKQFRNQIAAAHTQLSSAPTDQEIVGKAKSAIEAAIRAAPRIIFAESAEAQFLRKTMAGNPRAVLHAILQLRAVATNDENADLVLGTVLAHELRRGTADVTSEQRIQLEELIARASTDLAERTAEWERLTQEVNDAGAATRQSQVGFEKEHEEWIKTKNDQLEAFQSKWESQFGSTQMAYNAELGLQAPVTYWTAKRKHHASKAAAFARWLAWSFVAFFSAIGLAAAVLLDLEIAQISQIRLWHLTVVTVLILAAVWGLRILVRQFLGNSHLENDAHERITIANTYLALLRRGKVTEAEQRSLFEALMRHSTDGIVQDDAIPEGLISLLRKP